MRFAAIAKISASHIFGHPDPVHMRTSHQGYHRPDDGGSIEVFYFNDPPEDPDGPGVIEPGWFWWACSPGCMPDSEAHGPFNSSEDAFKNALHL